MSLKSNFNKYKTSVANCKNKQNYQTKKKANF